MSTLALDIGLLLTLVWSILTIWKRTKRKEAGGKKDYSEVFWRRVGHTSSPDDNEQTKEQSAKIESPGITGRIYYSTPGRRYQGIIWNGHIVKTEPSGIIKKSKDGQ